MLRYLPLVLKSCWRNRRRTTLTVLSVAASLSLLGVLMAIYHAFYLSDPTPEQALRLAVRHRVSLVFTMPESYGQKIRQIPGVKEVMMQNWFGGVYKDRRPENLFARFMIESDRIFAIRPEIQVSEEQKKAFQRDRRGALMSRPLADRLGIKPGDRFTLQGDIFPGSYEFTLRAVFDSPDAADLMYFDRKYVEEGLIAYRRGNVGMFAVLAETPEAVPRIARAIEDEFRNSPVAVKAEPERQFQLGFINSLGNVKMFLLSICAAVTFTVLLVTANTMAMSARERVREVGILKTLGFTRETILGLILGEAALVAATGGLIGLLLASALCAVVRQAPAFFTPLKTLMVPAPVALGCLGVAVAVGLVSAFTPAWGAARIPIVEELRAEE